MVSICFLFSVYLTCGYKYIFIAYNAPWLPK